MEFDEGEDFSGRRGLGVHFLRFKLLGLETGVGFGWIEWSVKAVLRAYQGRGWNLESGQELWVCEPAELKSN